MSSLSSVQQSPSGSRLSRVLSVIVGVLGVGMVITGVSVYAYTSHQLSAQGITVAAVSSDDPGPLAGRPVAGPFTALAQANAINHHMLALTDGKTFGELGNVATSDGKTYRADVAADKSTDGQSHQAGDTLSAADAKTYAARATAQTGSFLQASLLVSVVAFGVSALIIGLGLMFLIVAIALVGANRPSRRRV
jgi:hypothetical protein